MIRQTSLQAYDDLCAEGIGERQRFVLEGFKYYGKSTDLEMKTYLKLGDANMVRPRRNELYKLGLLMCVGKRPCNISGKKAMVWGVK